MLPNLCIALTPAVSLDALCFWPPTTTKKRKNIFTASIYNNNIIKSISNNWMAGFLNFITIYAVNKLFQFFYVVTVILDYKSISNTTISIQSYIRCSYGHTQKNMVQKWNLQLQELQPGRRTSLSRLLISSCIILLSFRTSSEICCVSSSFGAMNTSALSGPWRKHNKILSKRNTETCPNNKTGLMREE